MIETGILEDCVEKVGKKTGKVFYVIRVNGKEGTIRENLSNHRGKKVEVDFVKNGNFVNAENFKVIDNVVSPNFVPENKNLSYIGGYVAREMSAEISSGVKSQDEKDRLRRHIFNEYQKLFDTGLEDKKNPLSGDVI